MIVSWTAAILRFTKRTLLGQQVAIQIFLGNFQKAFTNFSQDRDRHCWAGLNLSDMIGVSYGNHCSVKRYRAIAAAQLHFESCHCKVSILVILLSVTSNSTTSFSQSIFWQQNSSCLDCFYLKHSQLLFLGKLRLS